MYGPLGQPTGMEYVMYIRYLGGRTFYVETYSSDFYALYNYLPEFKKKRPEVANAYVLAAGVDVYQHHAREQRRIC
jgi:hypothetical protein